MTQEGHKTETGAGPAHGHRWSADYIALWAIVIVSLLMNVIMLRQVVLARAASRQAIADAIAVVDQFEQTTLSTNIPIDNTVVIETDLPVKESIPVEIKTTLPIDTTVTVPVDAGLLGKLNLNVPIKTTLPVDVKPVVTIDQTFHVKAPVTLNMSIPVEISVGSTGLGATLDALKARLGALGDQLDAPLLPGLAPSTPEAK